MESLSAYARQFLGQMDKPDVDFIEGLSPAISIDQKSASRNPRSTVGTITEVYDYLRLLYARIGVPHCPKCGAVVARQTPQQIVDRVLAAARRHPLPGPGAGGAGSQGGVRGPARRAGGAGLHPGPGRRRAAASWPSKGQTLGPLRDAHHRGGRRPPGPAGRDRAPRSPTRSRRPCGWPTAWPRSSSSRRESDDDGAGDPDLLASTWPAPTAARRSTSWRPATSRSTRPTGRAPHCDGLGTRFEVDPELVVPNNDLTLDEGAIAPWAGRPGRVLPPGARRRGRGLQASASNVAVQEARRKPQQKVLLYGSGTKQVHVQYRNRYGRTRSYFTHYEGVVP